MPIDLRSDTLTQPSDPMRDAIRAAEVGDDDRDGDPSVKSLESRAAELLGTDAALFLPSGRMGNLVAANIHASAGDAVLVEEKCHYYTSELHAHTRFSNMHLYTWDGGPRGAPSPGAVHDLYMDGTHQRPVTGLYVMENTHNRKGGCAIAPDTMAAAAAAAKEYDVPIHLDGARLMNAVVALDTPADRFVEHVDSVMVDLSKGLAGPYGSILAGSSEFIAAARSLRKALGAGMRQVGFMAVAGEMALFDNVERLAEDHENATRLADGLRDAGLGRVPEPETNIVLVDLTERARDASEVVAECEDKGVHGIELDPDTVRFCTYRGVTRDDVETAIDRLS